MILITLYCENRHDFRFEHVSELKRNWARQSSGETDNAGMTESWPIQLQIKRQSFSLLFFLLFLFLRRVCALRATRKMISRVILWTGYHQIASPPLTELVLHPRHWPVEPSELAATRMDGKCERQTGTNQNR